MLRQRVVRNVHLGTCVVTLGVAADLRAPCEAELLAGLLTDVNATDGEGTVTLLELYWVGERLNSATELLSGERVCVLDVRSEERRVGRAGRTRGRRE